jgi:hypothetical protein
VDGDARPGLTLGRGGSEREIDEGDFPLRKNRGGRWATLVAALRGKGEGGSKLGGAWCRGERGGSLYSCGKAVRPAGGMRTRSSCACNGGSAGASVAE